VLVLNTLTAIITQQTNPIGILKAIGGGKLTITGFIWPGFLFYGVLALCIALPLGSLALLPYHQLVPGLVQYRLRPVHPDQAAVFFEALAALAVPLLAALFPILRGRLSPCGKPLPAMAWAVITARTGSIGRWSGGAALPGLLQCHGTRQHLPPQGPAGSHPAGVGDRRGDVLDGDEPVGLAQGHYGRRIRAAQRIRSCISTKCTRVDRTTRLAGSMPGVSYAGMWLVAPATILRQGRNRWTPAWARTQGLPMDDPMYQPMIVEGAGFDRDGHVIVMNKDTADDEHIRVGDAITLDLGEFGKDDWQVVGLYQVFLMFGGASAWMPSMPHADRCSLPPRRPARKHAAGTDARPCSCSELN
jgi:putative ABC transport system permease protein